MSYTYDETVELQRRLDNAKMRGLKTLELEKQRQAEAAETKRTQEIAQKEANAAVAARTEAALKSEAAQHWAGSKSEFDAAWPELLKQIRIDKVLTGMRSRERHTLD